MNPCMPETQHSVDHDLELVEIRWLDEIGIGPKLKGPINMLAVFMEVRMKTGTSWSGGCFRIQARTSSPEVLGRLMSRIMMEGSRPARR
jgi:hypothetical protein